MLTVAYQGARNAGLDPMNGYQGDTMEQGAGNILDFGIARGVQMHAEYSGHAQEFMKNIPEGQRPGIDAFRRNEGACRRSPRHTFLFRRLYAPVRYERWS